LLAKNQATANKALHTTAPTSPFFMLGNSSPIVKVVSRGVGGV
jgi:hypothetical protein